MKVPFNNPFYDKNFFKNIKFHNNQSLSSDGFYTKSIQNFFEKKYNLKKFLLTSSCTDALELSALLLDIKVGDEVIMPSYTFSSTANAFILRGAKIKFIDSQENNPNLDPSKLKELITKKTRCLVVVHYAGIACDLRSISRICKKNNVMIIEDAAQCINSFYNGKPLGTFGELGCLSFHETKNISSGEGGGLIINKNKYIKRAMYIRDKGTNRIDLAKGKIDKYGWVDIGSSFAPSDLIAKLLFSQKKYISSITNKRKKIWKHYFNSFKQLDLKGYVKIPNLDNFSEHNGHIFYLVCNSLRDTNELHKYLKFKNITAFGHYQSLHDSFFFKKFHDGRSLKNAEFFSNNLLRLPIYYDLTLKKQDYIIDNILKFYNQ